MKKENCFINALKFIACIFVITIHAPIDGLFGDLIRAVSRVGVPFFFAVYGRFLLTDNDLVLNDTQKVRRRAADRLWKLARTTLVVYAVYLCFSLFYHLVVIQTTFSEWITSKYNLSELCTFLLFNSGKFVYDGSYTFDHMWFLFALIYVLALIYTFAPVLRKWYKALIVILLLFLYFGEALQTYYPIRPFGIGISTWYVLRNWLFVAMPFVLIGVLFSDYVADLKASLGTEQYKEKAAGFFAPSVITCLLGLGLSFLERFLIDEKEVYVGSLICVVSLLFMSEAIPNAGGVVSVLGKISSARIYYYHVLIIAVVDLMYIKGFIPEPIMVGKSLLVITICILIFGILPMVMQKKQGRKRGE